MKRWLKELARIFVLTTEEKRVIAFVMLMILIGVGVKEYRKGHPPTAVPTAEQKDPALRKLSESSISADEPSASPADSPTPRAKRSRKPRKTFSPSSPSTEDKTSSNSADETASPH